MEFAKIHKLPALVGLEFPHGKEIIHTSVDGMPIHYASIDVDGAVKVWNTPCEPQLDAVAGAWRNAADDDGTRSETVRFLDIPVDARYLWFAESLRRINPGDMLIV